MVDTANVQLFSKIQLGCISNCALFFLSANPLLLGASTSLAQSQKGCNQQADLHLREIIKTGGHFHSVIPSQVPGITILARQDSILMGQRQLLGLRFAAVSEIIDHGAAAFNGIVDGLDNKAIDALPGAKILDDDEVASMMIGNLSEDARRAVGHMVLLQDLPPAAVGSVAEASLHQIDHRIQELQQVRQQIKAMADGTWTHPRFTSQ